MNKKEDEIVDGENGPWEEGGFVESLGPLDIKKKMRTFHMKHDEEMNYNCNKCNKRISAHNKDWHNGKCDDCFNEEIM